MSLEQKLAKLDELTNQMDNDIPLDKALQLFEQSVVLAEECMATLNDCKGKLVVLQEKVARITKENEK